MRHLYFKLLKILCTPNLISTDKEEKSEPKRLKNVIISLPQFTQVKSIRRTKTKV
jgi:hypothetical protein